MPYQRRDSLLLAELTFDTASKLLKLDDECSTLYGFHLRCVNAFRDPQEQLANYLKGRDPLTLKVVDPGAVVTNAKPGQSFHEVRRAADVYPEFSGKVLNDDIKNKDAWNKMGLLASKHGLTWGGTFKIGPNASPDEPHLEDHWCETHDAYHDYATAFNISGNCVTVKENV